MAQTTTNNGYWNYPLEETNGNARASAASRQSSQNKSVRRVPSATDAWNVMSDSEGTKQRRQSLKQVNSTASRKRSKNALRDKKLEQAQENVDDSAWIHRDKLAAIEIQEMQQAGIYVRPSRRSISAGPGASARSSRSQSRSRRQSRDRAGEQAVDDEYNAAYPGYEEYERKASTIPSVDGEENFDHTIDSEFRTPEEVVAEREYFRPTNVIRPSTSRIPVSKASAVPVPSNVVGRDSPLPRSRGGSQGGPNSWDELQYARKARSNSMGSQAILDDGMQTPPLRPGSSHMRSSGENSPSKARVPTKATPTSGARKGSIPNALDTTARTTSNTSVPRPPSRNGPKSRPSTSHQHAPEGDPPWITSMYKPDPRLPPDQQMLPTHAKRMMQEQWEREGKTGTAYDRDLRLLNDNELPSPTQEKFITTTKPQNPTPPLSSPSKSPLQQLDLPSPNLGKISPTAAGSPNSPRDLTAWPLTPNSETGRRSTTDNASPTRPGTSGGYKITPTITTPPPIQRPPTATGGQMGPIHATPAAPRMPDLDEKADEGTKKKGGCGCCVVM